jgi:hypothetical protein
MVFSSSNWKKISPHMSEIENHSYHGDTIVASLDNELAEKAAKEIIEYIESGNTEFKVDFIIHGLCYVAPVFSKMIPWLKANPDKFTCRWGEYTHIYELSNQSKFFFDIEKNYNAVISGTEKANCLDRISKLKKHHNDLLDGHNKLLNETETAKPSDKHKRMISHLKHKIMCVEIKIRREQFRIRMIESNIKTYNKYGKFVPEFRKHYDDVMSFL